MRVFTLNSRNRLSFLLALICCLTLPAHSNSVDNQDSKASAVSADRFLNSIGVNIHASQGYDAAAYVKLLRYIGVHNIRDAAGKVDELLMLHDAAKVKVDLLFWCDLDHEISAANRLASANALLAIEGPNEPNNFEVTFDGQKGGLHNSWEPVARCQKAIYRAAKDNASLHNYPVFSASDVGAQPEDFGLQYLSIPQGAMTAMPDGTKYADYANVHNYVSSTNRNLYQDNQAWNAADPVKEGLWDGLYL